jgi:hypothetical protein
MKTSFSFFTPFGRILALALVLLVHASVAFGQSAYSLHVAPTTPTDYQVFTAASCATCQIINPSRAADADPNNFATMSTVLGLSSNQYLRLRLRLTAPVPAGSVAGVLVGSNRLLDLVTLSNVRIRTFLGANNNVVDNRLGGNAVEVKLIGANKYVLEFVSTGSFDRVEIGIGGLTDVVSTLDVYYAYGIPQATTPLGPSFTSTFPNPANNSEYTRSTTGVCVLCGVTNPGRAADQNLATDNYATIQTTVGALGDTRLRLRLNGVSPAGSVAGLVISTGSLIDLSLLSTLTIRTYTRDINGNLVLRETAPGGTLLTLNVLTGNRYYISFVTTEPFEYVELAVGGLVTVANTVRVYYAFGAPSPNGTPLPVNLVAFSARNQPDATVRVQWQTASEDQNAAFIVERSNNAKGGYVAVGEPVPGQGSTTTAHEYAFIDRGAATVSGEVLYYRLRQLDNDGTAHLSDVATVRRSGKTTGPVLSLWPNPARSELHVSLAGLPEAEAGSTIVLTLTDALGRTVIRQALGDQPELVVSVAALPPGRYLAQVTGAPAIAVMVE